VAPPLPAELPARRPTHPAPLPLRRPFRGGRELGYVAEAIEGGDLSADGDFSERCARRLEDQLGAARVLLTPSCTSALELAAALIDLGPGDEVVMPSFTSVSTALAFTRSGATPVFADIEQGTLNLCPAAAEAAITSRTRAIVPVHYAGVACDMEALGKLARSHGLALVEDAAHGAGASWQGRPLGSIGDIGCLSFHETKNLSCGEGGALVLRDGALVDRAEIVRDKGTNRRQFLQGRAGRYTWVDTGASHLMSELNAAFLLGQLEWLGEITERRLAIWRAYHERLAGLERDGGLLRPVVPAGCAPNAHVYWVLLPDRAQRDNAIRVLAGRGVEATFHYVPLHSSPAGRRLGRAGGELATTDDVAGRLLRLPLWIGMDDRDVGRVADGLAAALA
jgi:dTDP-4-amino-4,6-dideoxygalactose transaminase